MQRYICAMMVLWLVICRGTPSWGIESATAHVQALLEQAMEMQSRPALQGPEQRGMRVQLIRQLIAANFLSAEMARATVKESWETLSQTQRHEFETLFIDLFQDSYTRMVLNYLHRETVAYQSEQHEDGGRRVWTSIMRVNEHIPVEYFLVQKDGQWSIQDVTIDGVSVVGNYQNQFHKVILTQSFDALLKKMRLQSQAIRTNQP
jgi:phospholipid transport system substrate-binding protein